MERSYAGILGSIAMVTVMAHSLIHGHNILATLYAAPLALFAFAGVGLLIGYLADRTIVESIESRYRARPPAPSAPGSGALTRTKTATGRNEPA